MPALSFAEISSASPSEASAAVRARVVAARERQIARWGQLNASLAPSRLRAAVTLTPQARKLLAHAVDRLGISGRAHDRVLQVALTLRDLSAGDGTCEAARRVELTEPQLAEALSYRALERRARALLPPGQPVPARTEPRA